MLKVVKICIVSLTLIPFIASAHGPARVKVVEEIEINAPADKVWNVINEYCSIETWHPEIKSCQSDNGTAIESTRTIELENGEKLNEKLFKHEPDKMMMMYALQLEKGRVIEGLPIATHGAKLTVTPTDSGSKVTWSGAFYRSFPGQNPPPELSDEACKEAVTKLYVSGLEGIKKLAEQ